MSVIKKTLSAISLVAIVTLAPVQANAIQYTVVGGDYLAKIAAMHGTTWQKLHAANSALTNPNLVRVGQTVTIPGQASSAPAPAPAQAPAFTGCDLARSLINQYDWNRDVAYQVMVAESSCNPNAHNPESHGSCAGSFGLFQMSCLHGSQLQEPAANVAAAYNLWKAQGWTPWNATTCRIQGGVLLMSDLAALLILFALFYQLNLQVWFWTAKAVGLIGRSS